MKLCRLSIFACTCLLITSLFPLSGMGKSDMGFQLNSEVELVVPAAEGGGSDACAQAIATTVSDNNLSKFPFSIVYKAGGSGSAAFSYANGRSDANHTLLVANTSHLLRMYATSGALELVPIVRLSEDPILLVVSADSVYSTFADFVEVAKSRRMLLGTADILDRYCVWQLQRELESDIRSIYFNSALSIINGIIENQLDAGILNPSEASAALLAGKLRVLTTFSQVKQSHLFPAVSSLTDLGYHGLDLKFSRYVMGPRNMDESAIDYYSSLFEHMSQTQQWSTDYLNSSDLQDAFLNLVETQEFIEKFEIPFLERILAEGLID